MSDKKKIVGVASATLMKMKGFKFNKISSLSCVIIITASIFYPSIVVAAPASDDEIDQLPNVKLVFQVTVTVTKADLVITEKWVNWPDNCTICYNVTNIGNGTAMKCHNTTLYVDGVEVAHEHVSVDLEPGENYTGCFDDYIWTYTPTEDNVTVCADNNETVEESNETNNCAINTWMCGDVNEDHGVNVLDVLGVYRRVLDPGYPLDLPWAGDVNCDGNINVVDVLYVYRRALDPGYDLNCCCEKK